MNRLEIKTYPDPCLRIKTKPVEDFTQDIEKTLSVMLDIMYLSQGIGLAATQVGLGLSLLVLDVGNGPASFVNPVILGSSKRKEYAEEGCLSLPGLLVNVPRFESVEVRAQDAYGKFFIKTLEGMTARAFQHEFDHLNGRLILDYLDPIRRLMSSKRVLSAVRGPVKRTCEVICNDRKKNS